MKFKHKIKLELSFSDKLKLKLPLKVVQLFKIDRLKAICHDSVNKNEDFQDDVWKATYAYHDPKLDDAHYFLNNYLVDNKIVGDREESCLRCGRTREQIRWDELQPECKGTKVLPEFNPYFGFREKADKVKSVLLEEEKRFAALLEKGKIEIPILFKKYGENGAALAILHHTHGYDIETSFEVLNIELKSENAIKLENEYNLAMERERNLSKSKQKKEIILVNNNQVGQK